MGDEIPASSRKSGRSKSGCQTCRARKVRCDERPGVCLNCEKLGLPCAGATPTSVQNEPRRSPEDGHGPEATATSGLKRKRTFRSCIECRSSKTRCSGDKPVCARCRSKSLGCNYDDSSEPVWKQQLRYSGALQSAFGNGEKESGQGAVGRAAPDQRPPATRSISDNETPYHIRETTAANDASPDSHSWLHQAFLPDKEKVRVLVEYYFANIHPLRCFGFLHKPSFMQRLDAEDRNGRNEDALLLIVCALGALFLAADTERSSTDSTTTLTAGSKWARRAQNLILTRLGNIGVENLMAAVLLHDYTLRMSDFGAAFMLSALTARMAQALQINLEHSSDVLCQHSSIGPSASTKESRRRLMWCCYITDSKIGNGIDQLTLVREADINIQLPCNERNFLLQAPCVTEVLERGQFLKFVEPENLPTNAWDNMGIRAYFIRYISIRRRILKYIKHLNVMKDPWLPDSEFARLDLESRSWYESLPASLQFTPTAMYIRKETQQLGALCTLHYTYHATMCDLYRIGAPALYKVRSAFSFPLEQMHFLAHLQNELFAHARSLAIITAEALRHGPHALADSFVPTVLYDCCRVMLYYLTQLIDPAADKSKALIRDNLPLVRSNVKALRRMRSMYGVADLLSNAAEKMLEKIGETSAVGQSFIPAEPYPENDTGESEQSAPGTPVQSAPDYVLNPLSIYRMARKNITEKHEPERQPHASSPVASTSQSALQRVATFQDPPYQSVLDSAASVPAQGVSYSDTSQPAFDDLLSMFANDPSGWTWQPSDTAIGSQNESNGLPPWEPTYVDQQLDAWMPMFSGETQHYGVS